MQYQSARDPEGGLNVVLLDPSAHDVDRLVPEEQISHQQQWQWQASIDAERVRFSRKGQPILVREYALDDFVDDDGQLPRPAA